MKSEPIFMDDLISRQAAIDALKEKVFHNLSDEFYGAMQVLDELPSAQPEIVRCGNCRYFHSYGHPEDGGYCEKNEGWTFEDYWTGNDFCSRGERDETD